MPACIELHTMYLLLFCHTTKYHITFWSVLLFSIMAVLLMEHVEVHTTTKHCDSCQISEFWKTFVPKPSKEKRGEKKKKIAIDKAH